VPRRFASTSAAFVRLEIISWLTLIGYTFPRATECEWSIPTQASQDHI
jgi:hypothetical protein